jgi:hypothetical protein
MLKTRAILSSLGAIASFILRTLVRVAKRLVNPGAGLTLISGYFHTLLIGLEPDLYLGARLTAGIERSLNSRIGASQKKWLDSGFAHDPCCASNEISIRSLLLRPIPPEFAFGNVRVVTNDGNYPFVVIIDS